MSEVHREIGDLIEENQRLTAKLAEAEGERDAAQKELDDPNDASESALDAIWQDVILSRRPDYGPWEYPGQVCRHIKAEWDSVLAELARLRATVEAARFYREAKAEYDAVYDHWEAQSYLQSGMAVITESQVKLSVSEQALKNAALAAEAEGSP